MHRRLRPHGERRQRGVWRQHRLKHHPRRAWRSQVTGAATITGNITANREIEFKSPVELNGSVDIAGIHRHGRLDSTVNSAAAGNNLSISANTVTFGGNVGSLSPLGTLTVSEAGPTTLAGNITTTGAGAS